MKTLEPQADTIMQKETVVKEDGRVLIYYTFVPAPAKPDSER